MSNIDNAIKNASRLESVSNSSSASPEFSPARRGSSTSLSSIDADTFVTGKNIDAVDGKIIKASLDPQASDYHTEVKKMTDTYGNEFEVPSFSIQDIHNAIPKHCYERSAIRGLSFVARDVISLVLIFMLFHLFVTPENVGSGFGRGLLWAAYTFIQGCVGTGVWVLAHECGHQSFSPSKTINDTVGFILHSALLVPYFSWKISHGKHHKATGHLERDMVFVPKTRDEYASKFGKFAHNILELAEETPVVTAGSLIGQQLVGWLLYIGINITGHNFHHRQREGRGKGKANGLRGGVNHFNPGSPLYEAKDAKLILASDVGMIVTLGILFTVGRNFGWTNLLVWYILPYLWVNHWLVAITYLQHTDPLLPHYDAETWNFARGAAATIDRNLGFLGVTIMHGIVETHVLHHFVSTIPFYHAEEASKAIVPVLGKHYRSDVNSGLAGFLKALWTNARTCQWVESMDGDNKGVLFYRNRNKRGLPPAEISAPHED